MLTAAEPSISLGMLIALMGVVIVAIGLASGLNIRWQNRIDRKIDDIDERIDLHMTREETEAKEMRDEISLLRRTVSYLAGKVGVPWDGNDR